MSTRTGPAGLDPLLQRWDELASAPVPTPRRRWPVPVGLATVAAVALGALGLQAGGVNALFTDNYAVPANNFSTGTLDLTASPASSAIQYVNMVPGDSAVQPLTIGNAGSTPLRYAIRSTTTEDVLAAQLDLTIKSGVASCTTPTAFAATGTVIYGPGDVGSVATTALVGSNATGFQVGDRTLAPSTSETLCFQVNLPLNSANSFQAKSTTATFLFESEQTANNP